MYYCLHIGAQRKQIGEMNSRPWTKRTDLRKQETGSVFAKAEKKREIKY